MFIFFTHIKPPEEVEEEEGTDSSSEVKIIS
jgi:hypothetical protein